MQENICAGDLDSLSIVLPEIDFIKITSALEITAKFLASPIESRNSFIEVITSVSSITSSSCSGDNTNSCSFNVGIAPTWSET